MMCPLTKKSRSGDTICGGYRGRCQYPLDTTITCELRDGPSTENTTESKAGSRARS
jgi:hypothetical protein